MRNNFRTLTRREFLAVLGLGEEALIACSAITDSESVKQDTKTGGKQHRIYFKEGGHHQSEVWSMDEDGKNLERLTNNDFEEEVPAISPDGRWLAYAKRKPNEYTRANWDHEKTCTDLYVCDLETGKEFSFDGKVKDERSYDFYYIRWHPTQPILAAGTTWPNYATLIVDFNETKGTIKRSALEMLMKSGSAVEAVSFSPDGKHIAYYTWYWTCPGTYVDRKMISGERLHHPLWSPKGDRLIFASDKDVPPLIGQTRFRLNLMNPDGSGRKVLSSTEFYGINTLGSSLNPSSWSPDGTRVAFTNSVREIEYGPLAIYITNVENGETIDITRELPDKKEYKIWDRDRNFSQVFWSADGNALFLDGFVYRPTDKKTESRRTMISRINTDGSDFRILREGIDNLLGYR